MARSRKKNPIFILYDTDRRSMRLAKKFMRKARRSRAKNTLRRALRHDGGFDTFDIHGQTDDKVTNDILLKATAGKYYYKNAPKKFLRK